MKIIDFHTHIYPHKIAEKAVSSVGEFYNLKMQGEGTAENLLKQGEKHNISNFVVHSVAVTPSHVQTINDYIASECEQHSEFYGFGVSIISHRITFGNATDPVRIHPLKRDAVLCAHHSSVVCLVSGKYCFNLLFIASCQLCHV